MYQLPFNRFYTGKKILRQTTKETEPPECQEKPWHVIYRTDAQLASNISFPSVSHTSLGGFIYPFFSYLQPNPVQCWMTLQGSANTKDPSIIKTAQD